MPAELRFIDGPLKGQAKVIEDNQENYAYDYTTEEGREMTALYVRSRDAMGISIMIFEREIIRDGNSS